MKKYDCTSDWNLYQLGIEYNHEINPDYYATTNRNERFYVGDQWNGISSNGLPMFILNIFKRIIGFFISSIMSSPVKMRFIVENISDATADPFELRIKEIAKLIEKHSALRWEDLKMNTLLRDALLDAALSGDMCAYTYWDDSVYTGQTYGSRNVMDENGDPMLDDMGMPQTEGVPVEGDFVTELVDGCNVMFGNANDRRVNVNCRPKQPYIIISGRDVVKNLRAEAKKYKKETGLSEREINTLITFDSDTDEQAGDRSKTEVNHTDDLAKATYIIKLWYEDGKLMFNKSVENCYIRKEVDTGLTIYPIAWGNWDKRKNSYHGQAVGTGLVENQIQINAAFAKVFKWLSDMAFPKTVFNNWYVPEGLTNRVGEVIEVQGNADTVLSNAVYQVQPAQMASGVLECINMAYNMTKELMGVSDVALGQISNPENTSAIIATQKATAIPLENVKENLYQFVEDIGYCWLDEYLRKYKVPRMMAYEENGQRVMMLFDSSMVQSARFRIKVDVGPSIQGSEAAAITTLGNLLSGAYIDIIQYLERIPDEAIPDKYSLIEEIKKQKAAMMGAVVSKPMPPATPI